MYKTVQVLRIIPSWFFRGCTGFWRNMRGMSASSLLTTQNSVVRRVAYVWQATRYALSEVVLKRAWHIGKKGSFDTGSQLFRSQSQRCQSE